MKLTFKISALGGLALAAACGVVDGSQGSSGSTGGGYRKPATTAELFRERCASCHGLEATGSAYGPGIRHPVRDEARASIRTGRDRGRFATVMPGFTADVLTDSDVGALIDHLWSFEKPKSGAGLYANFCARCHGDQGEGGTSKEPLLRKAVREADEFEEAIREGHHLGRFSDDEYMPRWSSSELTDGEVALIVDHLRNLAADGGVIVDGGKDDDDDDDDDDHEVKDGGSVRPTDGGKHHDDDDDDDEKRDGGKHHDDDDDDDDDDEEDDD